jgi:Transcriptional regulator of heat shock gene
MTTGAVGPDASEQRLEHIKLFPLDDKNAICVFITNSGHTETKNFHFDEAVSVKDIESCTDILNEKLKNVRIDQLVDRMETLKPELSAVVERHDLLFAAFVKAFIKFASENVYFSGKDKMLYQPEFEDINKLKKLMTMLDDSTVWKNMSSDANAVAVTTKGAELTWINDLAVVRSKFHVNDEETGEFMVVGPSRMNYDKIVAMVEYAAKMIEKMYNEGGGDK